MCTSALHASATGAYLRPIQLPGAFWQRAQLNRYQIRQSKEQKFPILVPKLVPGRQTKRNSSVYFRIWPLAARQKDLQHNARNSPSQALLTAKHATGQQIDRHLDQNTQQGQQI